MARAHGLLERALVAASEAPDDLRGHVYHAFRALPSPVRRRDGDVRAEAASATLAERHHWWRPRLLLAHLPKPHGWWKQPERRRETQGHAQHQPRGRNAQTPPNANPRPPKDGYRAMRGTVRGTSYSVTHALCFPPHHVWGAVHSSRGDEEGQEGKRDGRWKGGEKGGRRDFPPGDSWGDPKQESPVEWGSALSH